MSIEKYRRVIWRMQEMDQATPGIYSNAQLDRAIMEEIGTHKRTIKDTKEHMKKLGMISSAGLGLWKVNVGEKTAYGYGSPQEIKKEIQEVLPGRVLSACLPADADEEYLQNS